jgi:hypothetical protein
MMPSDSAALLKDGLSLAGWDVTDLWFAAFALGGDLTPTELAEITAGDRPIGHADYDVLAAALNDEFADQGMDHPVPYWADLPGGA